MPAVSLAQQRLFGMVIAKKRGQLKNPSAKIKNVAAHISESSAEDFARTSFKKKKHGISKSLMMSKSGY